MDKDKKTFHTRGFVSLLTAFSFAVILLTGVVLYFVPQGRIAYWTDWRFLALTKTDWTNIHITSGLLFGICACYHLYLNWRPFTNYLLNKVSQARSMKKEQALATVIILFFVIGTILSVPPLSYIVEFSDYLKGLWVKKELEPPFGHAEQLSLKSLAKRTNIDLEKALAELKDRGFVVQSENQSLSDVAKKNRTSPMKVYEVMVIHTIKEPVEAKKEQANQQSQHTDTKLKQKQGSPQTQPVYTADAIEERLAGKGIGKKTLDEISAELGIKTEEALQRLKKQGIEATKDQTFKEIANRYNTTPIEIAKIAFASK